MTLEFEFLNQYVPGAGSLHDKQAAFYKGVLDGTIKLGSGSDLNGPAIHVATDTVPAKINPLAGMNIFKNVYESTPLQVLNIQLPDGRFTDDIDGLWTTLQVEPNAGLLMWPAGTIVHGTPVVEGLSLVGLGRVDGQWNVVYPSSGSSGSSGSGPSIDNESISGVYYDALHGGDLVFGSDDHGPDQRTLTIGDLFSYYGTLISETKETLEIAAGQVYLFGGNDLVQRTYSEDVIPPSGYSTPVTTPAPFNFMVKEGDTPELIVLTGRELDTDPGTYMSKTRWTKAYKIPLVSVPVPPEVNVDVPSVGDPFPSPFKPRQSGGL